MTKSVIKPNKYYCVMLESEGFHDVFKCIWNIFTVYQLHLFAGGSLSSTMGSSLACNSKMQCRRSHIQRSALFGCSILLMNHEADF